MLHLMCLACHCDIPLKTKSPNQGNADQKICRPREKEEDTSHAGMNLYVHATQLTSRQLPDLAAVSLLHSEILIRSKPDFSSKDALQRNVLRANFESRARH